jgi:glycosyltransferase involved in cell wall biosynthesis
MQINPKIAILIPCYNEEITIGQVIRDFKLKLPDADVYVYDNNSKDKTVEKAREAGAIVRYEKRQGKGFVIQKMFQEISADIYVMIDGDNTYPAKEIDKLLAPVLRGEADMVVGSRLMSDSDSQFKKLNWFGNKVFLWTINQIFRVKLTDILSGYRVFNRQIVKSLPLFAGGFQTETELTIKALTRGYQITEVPVSLIVRPEGSFSKINIFRDGFLITYMIFSLFRDYKPMTFFGGMGIIIMMLGFIPGTIVIYEFIKTGLVLRLPSAVLAIGLELFGILLITAGIILHTIVRHSQEFDYQLRILSNEIGKNRNESLAISEKENNQIKNSFSQKN